MATRQLDMFLRNSAFGTAVGIFVFPNLASGNFASRSPYGPAEPRSSGQTVGVLSREYSAKEILRLIAVTVAQIETGTAH